MARVVLVEDDTAVRNILCEVIGKAGYELDCVRTHHDAVAALTSKKCDLLVADVRLPDGKAYDLVEMASGLGTKVLLITGNFDEMPAVQACHTSYLIKPFALDQFLEEIALQVGDILE